MTKRKVTMVVSICILTLIFLHSIPTLALRTSVFLHGYPITALITEIQEYEPYHKPDREPLKKEGAKLYKLTPPPIEKATKGHLYTWKVNRKGFLYFASYYGEGI